MACRLPNRPLPHEPSVIVDPRVYLEDRADAPPLDAGGARDLPEPSRGGVLGGMLRAAALIALSACASFTCVQFLRGQLAGTADAALEVAPRAAPALVPPPASAPTVSTPVVSELAPSAPPAPAWMLRVQRARALHAAGRLDEAEAAYRAVMTQRAEVPAVLLGLARVRLARGDCSEASALALRVLARMPRSRAANDLLASCLRVDHARGELADPALARRLASAPDAALPSNPF